MPKYVKLADVHLWNDRLTAIINLRSLTCRWDFRFRRVTTVHPREADDLPLQHP